MTLKNSQGQKISQKTNTAGNIGQSKQKIPKKENSDIQIQRQNIQSQNQFQRCRKSNHQIKCLEKA